MRIRKRSLLPFITLTPARPLSDLLPHKNPSQKEQETIERGAETAVEDPAAKADEGDEVKGLHPDEDLKQVQSSRDFARQSSLRRPKAVPGRSPSDLQLTIVKRKNQWILSDDKEEKPANANQVKVLQGEEEGDVDYKTNRRDGNSSGAEAAAMLTFPSSSSPPHVLVRRCDEGERSFPLKKRRGSLGYGSGGMIMEKERKMMKIKRPKKLNDNDGDYDYEEEEEEDNDDEEIDVGVRKRGKGSNGGALMEGSRCSRVNGRGWRCCQQTLVGYSLCEHHLGKGRLRSMSSVRSRSSAVTRPTSHDNDNLGLLSSSALKGTLEEMNADEVDEEIITTMKKKKRKKIGMVKARSISSLLGQTHHIKTIAPVTSAATGDVLV